MDGLSSDKALLMEIALGLLGNNIYNVYGIKQDSLTELLRVSAIPGDKNSEFQSDVNHMMPHRSETVDQALPLALCYGEPVEMSTEYNNSDAPSCPDPNEEFKDQEFIKEMMSKIEREYSDIKKESIQQKQTYFMEIWIAAANNSTSSPVAEIDVMYIAKDFFNRERNNLEQEIKEQRESLISMKKSGKTIDEIEKIQKITKSIELVKKAT